MNPLDEINTINSNTTIVKSEYLRAKDISSSNKSNTEIQKIYAEITQKYVQTNSSGEALATVFGVDYQTLQRLEEIEKWFLYHRFYFLGSDDPILRKGNDFSNWDPRYMEDYIIEATQKGYKNYFLYYDRNEGMLRPKSALALQDDLRNLEGNCSDTHACATSLDVFVGCIFFEKQECTEYKNIFSYVTTLADFNESLNNLKKKLGVSKISDNGYISINPSETFGDIIDINQQLDRYNHYEAQYKEFCDKMITTLADVPYLQFCVNKSSGVFEGENINISQVMNCTQNIPTTEPPTNDQQPLIPSPKSNKNLSYIIIIICITIIVIEFMIVSYRKRVLFTSTQPRMNII
jgi:hypothetical protein